MFRTTNSQRPQAPRAEPELPAGDPFTPRSSGDPFAHQPGGDRFAAPPVARSPQRPPQDDPPTRQPTLTARFNGNGAQVHGGNPLPEDVLMNVRPGDNGPDTLPLHDPAPEFAAADRAAAAAARESELAGPVTNFEPAFDIPMPARTKAIGPLLIDAHRLSQADAKKIAMAADRYRLRFGEAGVRLGLLKPEDVDYALARQFEFPYVSRANATLSRDIVAAYEPNHPTVEQIRTLQIHVANRAPSSARSNPVVAVISSDRRDGRSFIAANLAVVFAQAGMRTLLIDADLRSPVQHRFFKIDNRRGLSTMLAGRSGADSVTRVASMPRLYVLPSGPIPPNPLVLLGQAIFRQVLDSAESIFNAVIIDTPAGEVGSDALLTAERAGASVVVGRADHSRSSSGRRFAQAISRANVNPVGAVFNEY